MGGDCIPGGDSVAVVVAVVVVGIQEVAVPDDPQRY